ncbi:uncharacterized protein TRIREDRAFT_109562 [Trichoderma reesei QM6a]|uniref:Predicted protein n=2 Tax=Hypocrea jecorina TaxID=51453 RepID=G0RPK2_HYPJQ|nr:uncharacterized protein TRIREDRAFT_109562 [Trichoderma reesei QM6a]EGR46874.1 predicted protein [Trichoderma reesei QM6a]ETS00440.1 hypothetical protein M419DRAFT_131579 [Trichoderma reesei RUT C-30]
MADPLVCFWGGGGVVDVGEKRSAERNMKGTVNYHQLGSDRLERSLDASTVPISNARYPDEHSRREWKRSITALARARMNHQVSAESRDEFLTRITALNGISTTRGHRSRGCCFVCQGVYVEFGVQNKGVDALSRTMREDKCNSLPSRFEVQHWCAQCGQHSKEQYISPWVRSDSAPGQAMAKPPSSGNKLFFRQQASIDQIPT